jgi:hypothetical protein
VVEAGRKVDGTCIGWDQDQRGAHGPATRSIADELGGYLAGRPSDADALVFTARWAGRHARRNCWSRRRRRWDSKPLPYYVNDPGAGPEGSAICSSFYPS